MLKSIIQRLELAEERFNFLEKEISQSEIINNPKDTNEICISVFLLILVLLNAMG